MTTTPAQLARVLAWTFYPQPKEAIHELLTALSDDEVGSLMNSFTGAAATLGWLEYGRRKGYINCIHIDVVQVKGEFEVKVGVQSPVIVENVTLDSPDDEG